jgi:excisionase family DNA binding protein
MVDTTTATAVGMAGSGDRYGFLTTGAAAAELGLQRDRVRELCEEGAFPNAQRAGSGGHWRIPASDVRAFIERNRPIVRRKWPA